MWTFYNSSGEAMIADGAMTIANNADNRVVTATGNDPASLNGESTLTYDGTHLTISDGNLVIGTAGHGIDFSATSDAGVTTPSELFDDYEEGTFTPILDAASNTSSGMGHTTQFGHYTKIGNRVHINLRVVVGSTGDVSSGSSAMCIRGLPFTCDNTSNSETGLIVGYSAGIDMTAGHAFTAVTDANGTAQINFRQNSDGAGFAQGVTRDNITTTCTINISGMYEVDS